MSAVAVGEGVAVGLPTHERVLTDALQRSAGLLLPPGRGRSLYVLSEVSGRVGRPDVLLLAASPGAVESSLRDGQRLANFTEAEILGSALTNQPSRHSKGHERGVRRRLHEAGWLDGAIAERRLGLVHRSLVVEAKVNDWGRGIFQLARTRSLAHTAALAMPASAHQRVDRELLRRQRLGLIRIHDGVATWQVRAPYRQVDATTRLWLSELLLRHVEAVRCVPRSGTSARLG